MSPALAVFQCVWYTLGRASCRQCGGGGGSACLLWFTVSRVPVSRQAWSSGSCTPALSHRSAWQAKLLKGWTGAHRPRLAQLTHETKTQCYQSASASLWCQSVLLKRESLEGYLLCRYHLSRLPPHLQYVDGGAGAALPEDTAEKIIADVACVVSWSSFEEI